MDRIIVGVDGSDGAADALAWAVAEAEVRGWTTRAIMAWGWVDQHRTLLGETFDPGYSESDAQATLHGYLERAVGAQRAAGVEGLVVAELPAPALLDASRDAALLVVGARGLGGFRGLLLGSVSQRCLHHAHCPVAVLRSERRAHQRTGHVVVGVDGSDGSAAALRWAIDEAVARGATLEAVHAWQAPVVDGYPLAAMGDPGAFEATAHEELDAALADVDQRGTAVQRSVVRGSGAAALVEASTRADLVVVGAHGRWHVHGTVVGSVSQQVAIHADAAVVVVRTR
jgi:nucleotide-binding universal stress UspA family protein